MSRKDVGFVAILYLWVVAADLDRSVHPPGDQNPLDVP